MKKTLSILLCLSSSVLYAETDTWGVEVNPFRLLISDSDWQSFTGTISHFDNETGVEIAIPVFYSKEKHNYYYEENEDTDTVFDIDLHYRKYFTGNRTHGAYVGAFGRYTYIDGKVRYEGKYATVKKFGLAGEIGFKVKDIFDTPFYWGASLSLGGYIGNDNDIFNASKSIFGLADDDNKMILDLELLKVGYEF